MGAKRLVPILVLALSAAAVAVVSDAPAGGISDEPCPNVAGENTNTCPPSKVGTPYSIRFVETEGSGCGPGKQTFHFDSGVLPPGLTLASDGMLSGIPTQVGTFRFYVEMREPQDDPANCAGKRTQKQFTLKICRQLSIVSSPAFAPRAEVGAAFQMTLSSCGGMGVLVWALSAGELPAGLTLRADGSIFGAPRVAGRYRFTVRATDTQMRSVGYTGTLSVAAKLLLRKQRFRPAKVGHVYRAKLTAAGGVVPTVWKVTRGRLPSGIRLVSALGVFTGTPRKAGRHRVTVEVRDGLKVKSTNTFTIVVLA
jgi:large repetitive protein